MRLFVDKLFIEEHLLVFKLDTRIFSTSTWSIQPLDDTAKFFKYRKLRHNVTRL